MNKELKKTVGHAGVYSIGIILNRAISFVMLPVYTRYLTPSDYGIIEILEMTADVLSIFAGMGLVYTIAKFYYQYQTDQERQQLVSTIFIMVITFFFFACLAGVAVSPFVSFLVFGTKEYTFYLLIAFVNLFFQFLVYIPMAYIRTQQKPVFFVVVSSIKLMLQLFLNILLLVYLEMGVLGVLYSTLISSVIIGGWLTFYTFSQVRFRFSRDMAVQLLRFGWPFIFTGVGAFVLTYSDRYFLNYYWELSDVGIYALGYKFGFLLMMFPVTPLMNIWMVQRFELVNKEGYEKTFNQFFSWFSIITLTVVLIVSLTVHDVLRIMSAPAFWDAYRVVPIILLAYFIQACTDFFNFGIFYTGKTKHMAYGTFLAVIVIIAMSFLLIPRFGIYGAAWATLVSFGARLGYVYWASQKLFRIQFEWGRPLATTAVAVLIYLGYWASLDRFTIFDKTYWSLPFGLVMLLFFFFSLLRLNIINTEEKKAILSSVKSPLRALAEIRGIST